MQYRIKELLKGQNLSISELAEKINVKRESLSRIVNGASTSVETLQCIADVLGVHITELFEKESITGFIKINSDISEINCVQDIKDLLGKIEHK